MENVFFKYGVLIVGVVIITLLMSFAFSALDKTIKVPESREQEFEGTASEVKYYIEQLCDKCVTNRLEKDCFIVEFEITDEILSSNVFSEEIVISNDLNIGKNVVKVSLDDICIVKRLE